ncbi:MAG: SGNH/GDSL hydrolase family protein [Gammaproteobacteria bacterium]|nr:SGNH/GDSL hydrolase family protein [Gammaproteobacteria bacterium]
MKTVLIYGDSNTWGLIPNSFNMKTLLRERYDFHQRWPGVAQRLLGNKYTIIEEALCGRTTAFDDPLLPGRNGMSYLRPCLESHNPIDLLTIMLGTNDMKNYLSVDPTASASGIRQLIRLTKLITAETMGKSPEILIIAPPNIVDGVGTFAAIFKGAEEKSKALAENYQAVAELEECHFINAAEITKFSDVDGIHLDDLGYQKLGTAVAEKIRTILV